MDREDYWRGVSHGIWLSLILAVVIFGVFLLPEVARVR